MKRRDCLNCCAWTRGILCIDCVRMIIATVVAELIVAAVLWVVRE